jgi:hypothetical protein
MAIVVRRYVDVGPPDQAMFDFVSSTATPVIVQRYPRVTVDISVDDAVPDLIQTLDDFMATINLQPTITLSPTQVFEYVATGTEPNPLTIGAPEGMVARASTNYIVHATLRTTGGNAIKKIVVVDGSQTLTQFQLRFDVPLEMGDILMLTLDDLS